MENKNKNQETHNGNNTSNRGFASMPREKVVEIAKKGGEASHGGTVEKGHQGAHASGSSKNSHKEEKK
jgi:uncharacterized protein